MTTLVPSLMTLLKPLKGSPILGLETENQLVNGKKMVLYVLLVNMVGLYLYNTIVSRRHGFGGKSRDDG